MVTFKVALEKVEISQPALVAEVSPIVRHVHAKLTRNIAREARVFAPVGKTGRLKSSIREDQQYFSGLLTMDGGVTAHAPYAAAIELGARQRRIYPRHAPSLRFFWEREGRMFIGRRGQSVNHPATRPNPFLMRAARRAVVLDPDITPVLGTWK